MALTFQKTLAQDILLNAFNNNIVEFSTTLPKVPYKCVITVNGDSYEITPNQDGSFYFNFRTIFSQMIVDELEDSRIVVLDSQDLTSYVKDMSSIFLEVAVNYTVYYEDGSTEQANPIYSILQSVTNFQEFRNRQIQKTDSFAVLSPLKDNSNRTFDIAYFEGYPFDIQVYKRTSGNVLVTNRTTGLSETFNFPNKVNRIFFSDTRTDNTIQDVLPLVYGVNQLEFNTSEQTTIFLDKKRGDCGKYLKWKNAFGGWSYWLFEDKHQQERDIDDLGYVNNDFDGPENPNYIKNIGKSATDRIRLNTKSVDPKFRPLLNSLFESPKVYLYMGEQYSKNEGIDWLSVRLVTDSIIVKQYKDRWTDLGITIELPQRRAVVL